MNNIITESERPGTSFTSKRQIFT